MIVTFMGLSHDKLLVSIAFPEPVNLGYCLLNLQDRTSKIPKSRRLFPKRRLATNKSIID